MSSQNNQKTFGRKGTNSTRISSLTSGLSFHTNPLTDHDHPYNHPYDHTSRQPLAPIRSNQGSNIQNNRNDRDDTNTIGKTLKRSAAAAATTTTSQPTQIEKKAKSSEIQKIISNGNYKDIEYLKNSIDRSYKINPNTACMIKLPSWSTHDVNRFIEWIESLGFAVRYLNIGTFYQMSNYEETDKVLRFLNKMPTEDSLSRASSHNSSFVSLQSVSEDTEYGQRNRAASDTLPPTGLRVDTDASVATDYNWKASTTGSITSHRTYWNQRSRNSSIDGFDNSPVGSFSNQPSPFSIESESPGKLGIPNLSLKEPMDRSRSSTESPTVQLSVQLGNAQFFSDTTPHITQAIAIPAAQRNVTHSNRKQQYPSSSSSSSSSFSSSSFSGSSQSNTLSIIGEAVSRSKSDNILPKLTESALESSRLLSTITVRKDTTEVESTTSTEYDQSDDFIRDPDIDLALLQDMNIPTSLTDKIIDTNLSNPSPPFKTITHQSPIQPEGRSRIDILDENIDNSMTENKFSNHIDSNSSKNSTSNFFHPNFSFNPLNMIKQLVAKKTERSPLSSENGNFSKVSGKYSGGAITTVMQVVSNSSRHEVTDFDGENIRSGSKLKKAQTIHAFTSNPNSSIKASLYPGSPLDSNPPKSYSQNDAEVYSTPQSMPLIKTMSGIGYDWSKTETACLSVCQRLIDKFVTSHDDTFPTTIFHPDNLNSVRLQRSLTVGDVSDLSHTMNKSKLSSNALFHMEPTSSRPSGEFELHRNTSLFHNEITSLPTIESAMNSFSNIIGRGTSPFQQTSLLPGNHMNNHMNINGIAFNNGIHDSNRIDIKKSNRNLTKSKQKWRRMSIGFRNSHKKNSLEISIMSNGSNNNNNSNNSNGSSNNGGSGNSNGQHSNLEDLMHIDTSSSHQYLSFESATSLSPAVSTKYRTSTNYKLKFNTLQKNQNNHLMNMIPKGRSDSDNSSDRSNNDDDGDDDDLLDMTAASFLSPRHGRDLSQNSIGSIDHLHGLPNHNVDQHCNMMPILNEQTFRVNIIGGTYQHSFQGRYPLIAPPSTSDNRVVGIHFSRSDGSLALRLYISQSKSERTIQFSSTWTWVIAKPIGCIVFKDSTVLGKESIGYFVLQHPSDWDDHSPFHRDQSQHFDRLVASAPSANTSFISSASHPQVYQNTANLNLNLSYNNNNNNNHHHHSSSNSNNIHNNSHSNNTNIHSHRHGGLLMNDDDNAMNISINDHSGILHSQSDHGDEHNISSDSIPIVWSGRRSDSEILPSIEIDSDDISIDPNTAEKTIPLLQKSDWNNLSVISWILDYLIDYNNLNMTIRKVSMLKKSNSNNNLRNKPSKLISMNMNNSNGNNNSNNSNASSSHSNNSNNASTEPEPWLYVSKMWALATFRHYATYKSKISNVQMLSHGQWLSYMTNYNWGKVLGEGACKRVYGVQNSKDLRIYAVSLINMIDMQEREMEDAITQELTISMVCSSLNTLHICPNLVRLHSLFQCFDYPPKEIWESSLPPLAPTPMGIGHRDILWPPKKHDHQNKKYQYIRMEYCTGGDLDDLIDKVKMIDVHTVRIYLFQMIYALYSCREQLALRHYDIKLLNFLVTTSTTLLSSQYHEQYTNQQRKAITGNTMSHSSHHFQSHQSSLPSNQYIQLNIGFGQYIYRMHLAMLKNELVKLTDFGTSMIGASGLGDPITVQQFTTLENTPIEFLLLGSDARQAYSADAFCLGLSMLHLLTGNGPYESLLKDVKCPQYLATLIHKYWSTVDEDSPYYVISEVISSLDMSEEETNEDIFPGMVMYHTIYRYLVLFGSLGDLISVSNHVYASSPIWKAFVNTLKLSIGDEIDQNISRGKGKNTISKSRRGGGKNALLRDECQQIYQRDQAMWSITTGNHAIMKEFRERLHSLGDGSQKLLEKLIHFDPSRRCSLHEAIQSPIFDSLRIDSHHQHHHSHSNHHSNHHHSSNRHDQHNTIPITSSIDEDHDLSTSNVNDLSMAVSIDDENNNNYQIFEKVSYMHYYRSDRYGVDGLPML